MSPAIPPFSDPEAAFHLGAATAAHQVEGDNRNSDWWEWEEQGRTREPSGAACDHWHRYEEDFDLAAASGHDAHRFSVEWARIEPEPGRYDAEAIRHYQDVVAALRTRGLEPFVTLHHFTSPRWLAENGTWEAGDVAERFAAYARVVAEALAPQVRWWITINEPLVLAYRAYLEGGWAPGRQDLGATFRVIRNLARAHALAYAEVHAVHAERGLPAPRVSIAKHVRGFLPCRPWHALDRLSALLRDRVFNDLFVRGLVSGRLSWPGLIDERLPAPRTLDYLGLNYYTREFVRFAGVSGAQAFGDACLTPGHHGAAGRSALGWETHPEGLLAFLRRYRGLGMPLVITENGICTNDDRERVAYIDHHLDVIELARREGIDVRGYFYWSLLDNFEWELGYEPRFGMIEVDYVTQARHLRPSAGALRPWRERLARAPARG